MVHASVGMGFWITDWTPGRLLDSQFGPSFCLDVIGGCRGDVSGVLAAGSSRDGHPVVDLVVQGKTLSRHGEVLRWHLVPLGFV